MSQRLGLAPKAQELGVDVPPPADGKVGETQTDAAALKQVPDAEVRLEPLSRIVYYTDPRGLAADRFRFLRMRIRELSDPSKLKSLLVTSPLSLDGKSTVSVNLAAALSEKGQNDVLLLEADLYHPTMHELLGLEAGPGLGQCLSSGVSPFSVMRRLSPLGCYFLPAGTQVTDVNELLHGEELGKIMRILSPCFKWIIIDSPPIIPIADSLALARHADASLLVVRAGQTPKEAVERAVQSLGIKHVIGVVLNGLDGLGRLYSKYNKNYGSYSPRSGGK